MADEKFCGSCVNAKFRSDSCMCGKKEDMYLICEYTNKVVDFSSTCKEYESFPSGQPTWFQLADMMFR